MAREGIFAALAIVACLLLGQVAAQNGTTVKPPGMPLQTSTRPPGGMPAFMTTPRSTATKPTMPPPTPIAQRDKLLGAACKVPQDCQAAFSTCIASPGSASATCQCIAGLKPSDDKLTCLPQDYNCPTGEPIQANGVTQLCKRDRDMITYSWVSNCPANAYCLADYGSPYNGHCCPKPADLCPVGAPVPNTICSGPVPKNSTLKMCDQSTSFCFTMLSGLDTVCCPRLCTSGDVYKDGKCYRPKPMGQACEIDEQCAAASSGSACVDKKCDCKPGFINRYGYCSEIICPSGPGMYSPIRPQKDASGAVIKCKSDSSCSADSYCSRDFSVCCPIPAASCYAGNNRYINVTNPIACATVSDCPASNYTCQMWYTHLLQPDSCSMTAVAKPPVVAYSSFCCPPYVNTPVYPPGYPYPGGPVYYYKK